MPQIHKDLFIRIIKDDRLSVPTDLGQILKGDAGLWKLVLPWFFDRLEQGDSMQKWTWVKLVSAMSYWFTPQELNPYFDRFKAVLKANNFDSDPSQFRALVGRFGEDPMPVFRSMAGPNKQGVEQAFRAICLASPKWRDVMISEFWPHVEAYAKTPKVPYRGFPLKGAFELLSASGYYEQVSALRLKMGWMEERADARLEKFSSGKIPFRYAC